MIITPIIVATGGIVLGTALTLAWTQRPQPKPPMKFGRWGRPIPIEQQMAHGHAELESTDPVQSVLRECHLLIDTLPNSALAEAVQTLRELGPYWASMDEQRGARTLLDESEL